MWKKVGFWCVCVCVLGNIINCSLEWWIKQTFFKGTHLVCSLSLFSIITISHMPLFWLFICIFLSHHKASFHLLYVDSLLFFSHSIIFFIKSKIKLHIWPNSKVGGLVAFNNKLLILSYEEAPSNLKTTWDNKFSVPRHFLLLIFYILFFYNSQFKFIYSL